MTPRELPHFPETEQGRLDWLEWRRGGVGASEVAGLLGLSPYQSNLSIYVDKVKPLPPQPMTVAQRLGLALEPTLARLYCEAINIPDVEIPGPFMVEEHPYLRCTPDRFNGDINVQLKTAGIKTDEWGEFDSNEIPEYYTVQVQYEMLVTGKRMTHLPVLFLFGKEFGIYRIPYDEGLANEIFVEVSRFWTHHVVPRVEPEPINFEHPSTLAAIVGLRTPAGTTARSEAATPEIIADLAAYEQLGKEEKEIGERRDSIKAKLIHHMGTDAKVQVGNVAVLSLTTSPRKAYTVAAKDAVTSFRVLKPKE